MKHQQVSVDYWSMGKAMLIYLFLTLMGWMMLRLFNAVFTLPSRMRNQQETLQNTLQELQRRFPDMNITEEDLQNAEEELEKLTKEPAEDPVSTETPAIEETKATDESKKTI